MATEPQTLLFDQIRIDGGTQSRVSIDEQVVAEYADLYHQGIQLPPITVFYDGSDHWLADGFHRYWAQEKTGCDVVLADIHQGTQRDAILHAVGANAAHGLRRSNADKRKAVLIMLEDTEWSQWSNREIARQCGVDEKLIRRLRDSLSAAKPQTDSQPQVVKYKRGGKTHKQKSRGKPRARRSHSLNPIRQPRPALAQTNFNLPHDPAYGARAIVSAMGMRYAHQLLESLSHYLHAQEQKEGAA